MSGAGMLVGLLAGCGLLLTFAYSPPLRRVRIADRVLPYLHSGPAPSRLLDQQRIFTPFPALERLLGPVLVELAGRLDRVVGGAASVRRRLDRLGGELTVEQFRAEQLVWGAGGLLTGLVVTLVGTLRLARPNPVPFLLLCTILALAGGLARDRALTRAVSRREQQMLAEFPTVADLLALAITAGESPLAALARVTELCEGELSRELSRALAEARAGASFVNALDGIANRTGLPVLARFVDGVAVAVERGTPLADVLRAQAADVRDASKQALITAGGRKEIAMLVPVVFLVLPLAIVFVVFPGFYGLAVNVP